MSESQQFPRLGINTQELIDEIERLLEQARSEDVDGMGAVNWADLGIADIEYRISVLRPGDGPLCVVLVEEAAPGCGLQGWLNGHLDTTKFPCTYIECEW